MLLQKVVLSVFLFCSYEVFSFSRFGGCVNHYNHDDNHIGFIGNGRFRRWNGRFVDHGGGMGGVVVAMKEPSNKGSDDFPLEVQVRRDDYSWSPTDLTKNVKGYLEIPDDDYVKQYEKNPIDLWPVEFFIIVHRRNNNKNQTEILVRKSANGTSKWGLGTGVPVTRWMLSNTKLPKGYQLSTNNNNNNSSIQLAANNFPEYSNHDNEKPWTYDKIDICHDAFHGSSNVDDQHKLQDPELEEYAKMVRDNLRTKITKQLKDLLKQKNDDVWLHSWEMSRYHLVQNVLEKDNSVAAIQGTLRMSGIFGKRMNKDDSANNNNNNNNNDSTAFSRFISMEAIQPSKLANSMRIYTMFPQMPDPMPSPFSWTEDELKMEIKTRPSRMAQSGRDPHKDKYGRTFTHISTSNVSNTIVGVYLTLDVTDDKFLEDDAIPPAVDLFGTNEIQRHWISLQDLKVLDSANCISTEDPKPTFISGFIVRQLVKDGIIPLSSKQ